jgi:riboflavin kinase / FMN adenylyltransferase
MTNSPSQADKPVRLLRHLDQITQELQCGAVAIGNFDGVHLGHRQLVQRLIEHARKVDGPAIVFTFDPHPARLLRPAEAPPPLTWSERKAALLAELGVDAMIAYPTDEVLLSLSPRDFFDTVVCRQLNARAVVEGPNFRFGQGRQGDVHRLTSFCRQAGIELEIVAPLMIDGHYISSSRVREAVRSGDVDFAREMLTRPYRLRGLVTHGARRGATLGFPTANVEAVDTLLPASGVYAGRAWTADARWPAAIHIGPNLTFGEQTLKVEVHLIGYQNSLYGEPLEVDFLSRLRDIRPFASVDELKSQLERDVQTAGEIAERFAAN